MDKLTQVKLDRIVVKHSLWLKNTGEGVQADFRNKDLSGLNLSHRNMSMAVFNSAKLENVDFTGADLTQANFIDANLAYADLSNAKLKEANFTRAFMHKVNFFQTDICDAIGNRAELKTVSVSPQYTITYNAYYLQAGCIQKTLETWKKMTKKEKAALDGAVSKEWAETYLVWIEELWQKLSPAVEARNEDTTVPD